MVTSKTKLPFSIIGPSTFKPAAPKLTLSMSLQGYFCGKKIKILRDFQGQIRGKIGQSRRIFTGKKSKFMGKSADFTGFSLVIFHNCLKYKLRIKIGRFRRILEEKIQISKDFQGQILRKIGRFHGKFRGETLPRNNQ